MSNLQMWAIIVGALTPPLLAIIMQPAFPRIIRVIVMLAAATIDGLATAWLQGDLTGKRFVDAALMCGVAIIASYHGIFKPSGVAPAIEKATS